MTVDAAARPAPEPQLRPVIKEAPNDETGKNEAQLDLDARRVLRLEIRSRQLGRRSPGSIGT